MAEEVQGMPLHPSSQASSSKHPLAQGASVLDAIQLDLTSESEAEENEVDILNGGFGKRPVKATTVQRAAVSTPRGVSLSQSTSRRTSNPGGSSRTNPSSSQKTIRPRRNLGRGVIDLTLSSDDEQEPTPRRPILSVSRAKNQNIAGGPDTSFQAEKNATAGPGPSTTAHRAGIIRHVPEISRRSTPSEQPLGSWGNPGHIVPNTNPSRGNKDVSKPLIPSSKTGTTIEAALPAFATETLMEESTDTEAPVPHVKAEPLSVSQEEEAMRSAPGTWGNPIPYKPPAANTTNPVPVRMSNPNPKPSPPTFTILHKPSSINRISPQISLSAPVSPVQPPLGSWGNPAPLVPENAIAGLGNKRRPSPADPAEEEAVSSRKAAKSRRINPVDAPATLGIPTEPSVLLPVPSRPARPTWVTAPTNPPPPPPSAPSPFLPPTFTDAVDDPEELTISSPIKPPSDDPLLLNATRSVSLEREAEEAVEEHRYNVDPPMPFAAAIGSGLAAKLVATTPRDSPMADADRKVYDVSGTPDLTEMEALTPSRTLAGTLHAASLMRTLEAPSPPLIPAISSLRPSPAPSASSSIVEVSREDVKPIIERKKKYIRPNHIRRLEWFQMPEAKQAEEAAKETARLAIMSSTAPANTTSPNIVPPIVPSPTTSTRVNSSSSHRPEAMQISAGVRVPPPTPSPVLNSSSRAASTNRDKLSRIEWTTVVYEDGGSDVEIILDTASEGSNYDRTMTDAERDRYYAEHYDSTQIPPEERRGVARRHFNCTATDEWNLKSPTYTKNNLLHMTIISIMFAAKEGVAGEIPISNTVDPDHAPPELEFEYSNEMLYGPRVPDPELGLGCACDGPCSENDLGCSCLKRQQLYFYNMGSGFAYNKDGTLKNSSIPVWECGETCGCPPECMNRVIQRGRSASTKIEIIKTKFKGWGVRAMSKIPKGTFIGIYAGEMITEDESEQRGVLYGEIDRTYLFDLDGWQIRNPPAGLKSVDPRLAEIAQASAERATIAFQEVGDPHFVYNAFSVDAFHYGNYTRFFNHSCDPNLDIAQCYVKDYHPERPLLVIFARRDVNANEELCISYKGVQDDEEEDVPLFVQPKGKKGKGKQSKSSAAAHTSTKHKDADEKLLKNRCFCGTARCDGRMFNM